MTNFGTVASPPTPPNTPLERTPEPPSSDALSKISDESYLLSLSFDPQSPTPALVPSHGKQLNNPPTTSYLQHTTVADKPPPSIAPNNNSPKKPEPNPDAKPLPLASELGLKLQMHNDRNSSPKFVKIRQNSTTLKNEDSNIETLSKQTLSLNEDISPSSSDSREPTIDNPILSKDGKRIDEYDDNPWTSDLPNNNNDHEIGSSVSAVVRPRGWLGRRPRA